MPKAPRLCPGDDGHCTNLIRHANYCDDCTPKPWAGPRTRSSTISGTRAWRHLRRQVLDRDDHQCQIRHQDTCIGHATQVDHIISTAAGGPEMDPTNAQAACAPCNAWKATQEGAASRARRRAQPPATTHPGILR